MNIVACKDVTCGWASVPHFHDGDGVYPLPPDAPEWTSYYLAGFDVEATDAIEDEP